MAAETVMSAMYFRRIIPAIVQARGKNQFPKVFRELMYVGAGETVQTFREAARKRVVALIDRKLAVQPLIGTQWQNDQDGHIVCLEQTYSPDLWGFQMILNQGQIRVDTSELELIRYTLTHEAEVPFDLRMAELEPLDQIRFRTDQTVANRIYPVYDPNSFIRTGRETPKEKLEYVTKVNG
jgi:hypothetical protein